jgi:hypothetical protein
VYFLALNNLKYLSDLVTKYQASVYTPVYGKELEWVNLIKPIYEDMSYAYNMIISADVNCSILSSTEEYDSLMKSANTLMLQDKLRMLDGAHRVPIQLQANKNMNASLINGPYDLDYDIFTVNGNVITISNTATVISKYKANGLLTIRCYFEGGYEDITLDTSVSSSSDNLHFASGINNCTIQLSKGGRFFAFYVLPGDTAKALGLNSLHMSILATSADLLAKALGGNVVRRIYTIDINIVNGVQDKVSTRSVGYLIDRNDEMLILENGKAYNYSNSSLTYEGKIRVVEEHVTIPIDYLKDSSIPAKVLSSIPSTRVYSDKHQLVSPGDFIEYDAKYSEVLNVDNGELVLKDPIQANKDAYLHLGVRRLWSEFKNSVGKFPLVTFPVEYDINTLSTLLDVKSKLDTFFSSLMIAISKTKVTRRQSEYYSDMLNFLRRSHLAMRADRALDILFSSDIGYYYSLTNESSNYNLLLKRSIDSMRAKL